MMAANNSQFDLIDIAQGSITLTSTNKQKKIFLVGNNLFICEVRIFSCYEFSSVFRLRMRKFKIERFLPQQYKNTKIHENVTSLIHRLGVAL
jgi:hypothetical protein